MEKTIKEMLDSPDRVRVIVIGAGGTGSHFVDGLARLHLSAIALGHPGFAVNLFDDDLVESHNIGRQRFGIGDIGENKAAAIIARINRMYGTDWSASAYRADIPYLGKSFGYNLIVTAVDNNQTRKQVQKIFRQEKTIDNRAFQRRMYWLDMGNDHRYGQAVLGSINGMSTSIELFGEDHFPDTPESAPTCSTRDSLHRQDLFINQWVATCGLNLLWNMIRYGCTYHNAMFINAKDGKVKSGFYAKDQSSDKNLKPNRP